MHIHVNIDTKVTFIYSWKCLSFICSFFCNFNCLCMRSLFMLCTWPSYRSSFSIIIMSAIDGEPTHLFVICSENIFWFTVFTNYCSIPFLFICYILCWK